MLKWLWARLTRRYGWLLATHPIVARDTARLPFALPTLIRRLAAPWTLLGYAAMAHGLLFVLAILADNHFTPTAAAALMPLLTPFLTPFGTPLAAAALHTILYWAMLIGLCNQMTFSLGRDVERGAWPLLRLTPQPMTQVVLAKATAVARNWALVLQTILIVRVAALLVLPVAAASQRAREVPGLTSFDVASALIFVAQPLAEATLALAVGLWAAARAGGLFWGRLLAYGAVALIIGGGGLLNGLWLSFSAPTGGLAGLLVPLNHWAALLGAVSPPRNPAIYGVQTALLALTALVLPLVAARLALHDALRRLAAINGPVTMQI